MTSKTDKLIRELCDELSPTKEAPSPLWQTLRWFFAGFLCVMVGVLIGGFEVHLENRGWSFYGQVALIAVGALASAFSAFMLAVPSCDERPFCKAFPLSVLTVWFVYLSYKMYEGFVEHGLSMFNPLHGLGCVRNLLFLALIPTIFMFLMLKKAGAPIELGLTGFLGMLAGLLLASCAVGFVCTVEDPVHILLFHVLPVVVIAFVGVVIGKKILKW